eukprot:2369879-Ditylum_brightwellii.AAC.1
MIYNGPRDYISLVHCLSYGESDSLGLVKEGDGSQAGKKFMNKGTPQFWSLLAACSRGTKAVGDGKNFASDILKKGGLSTKQRIFARLKILQDLREKGIWLVDTSVVG